MSFNFSQDFDFNWNQDSPLSNYQSSSIIDDDPFQIDSDISKTFSPIETYQSFSCDDSFLLQTQEPKQEEKVKQVHIQQQPSATANASEQEKQTAPHHRRTLSTPIQIPQINLLALLNRAQLVQLMKANQNSNNRQKSLPIPQFQSTLSPAEQEFKAICQDPDVKFNPVKLGFIPKSYWADKEFTFGELVTDFFQRKNNANSRFYHKLYNALKIVDDPFYIEYVGIEWVNDKVLKVDKNIFARLLGIKTIDGSLFHQQGNFPSHGFVELGSQDSLKYVTKEDLEGVDYDKIRLLIHQSGVFTKNCSESTIENCKWISSKKRG